MLLKMPQDRRGEIISAAFDVFMNYGFRKTSMDDIARTAGMSRPALYQFFKNKTDIFRAACHLTMEQAAAQARVALAADKPLAERLYDALDTSILDLHRKIDATPHGSELIGVNDEVATDIGDSWCETMISVFAEAIAEAFEKGEAAPPDPSIDAEAVGKLIMQSMEGVKASYLRGNPIEQDVRNMVIFIASALAPGKQA